MQVCAHMTPLGVTYSSLKLFCNNSSNQSHAKVCAQKNERHFVDDYSERRRLSTNPVVREWMVRKTAAMGSCHTRRNS